MPLADSSTPPNVARVRIQNDELLRKVRLVGQKIVVYPKLLTEINGYFITARDLANRSLTNHQFDIYFKNPRKSLIDVLTIMAKVQAYRDRVTEIQVYLMDCQIKLEKYIRLATAHIYERYSSELKSRGAAEAQKYFIMSLLPGMHDKLESTKGSLKLVEAVLDNLDKAHFAYKAIAEFGNKLIDRMEGGRVATSIA